MLTIQGDHIIVSNKEYQLKDLEFKQQYNQLKKHPRIFFIVNPFSGTGKGLSIVRDMEKYLKTMDIQYTIKLSEYAGHEQIIASSTDFTDYDVIASCGGDGTLYAILNGVIEKHLPIIPVVTSIPCGSGNGVAFSLYGSSDPLVSLCHTVCGSVQRIDGMVVDHVDQNKKYYGILQFEFSYLASIDFESECLRFLGSLRFILWTLWYCVFLMCTNAVIKTKRIVMQNTGNCGPLCKSCSKEVPTEYDYTQNIADQVISQHSDPNGEDSKNDGWETLPYKSYCMYFFNNFACGMPEIEFAHGAHRHDGLIDTWILPGERATRFKFLGFWYCAIANIFVPKKISGFDYFRTSALSIQLEKDTLLGLDGERLPPGKNFNVYVAPSLYRTMLCVE
ncbi:DAGKc domain-containing protein [Entamoeba marina]